MPRQPWITVLSMAALFPALALAAAFGRAQDPAAPASPSPRAPISQSGKRKYSHATDFLIRGTVFNDKALSAPGVQLRIRRTGEKKFRWESYTNSRGEFAVRVPQGAEYEMVVHAKGFAEQTRAIDAKNGGSQDGLVFRMQPAAGEGK
jgi:hypothetical protein